MSIRALFLRDEDYTYERFNEQYLLCVNVGDMSPDPLADKVSRGMDSLTVGIVSAAPSISDVSASLNLENRCFI